jgi:hypothetical protein
MLSALAFAAVLAAADPAPVVAAERAFAADGLELGVRDSFLKYAAPEGIVLAPGPTLARKVFETPQPKGPPLVWWPLWAGIASSGDLGFTTGPYTYDGKPGGYYFTVWGRQPDGSWRWLMDAGPPSDTTGAAPQGSSVAAARASARSSGAKAMAEVAALEAKLAAASDARAAYLAVLADDARVVGSKAAPPTTRAAIEAELDRRPRSIAYARLGGSASKAGDLAWTYGTATWAGGKGHYLRVWRNDAPGWRLLFDELLVDTPLS